MGADSAKPVTELLKRWRQGDATALENLLPLVYMELRQIAERQLRKERPNQETAKALGVSPSTVKRDWAAAKAWLYRDMATRVSP